MKILVTGGAGYIGSVLVPELLLNGHDVTVVDNLMYKQNSLSHVISNKRLKVVFGDIRDKELMKPLIVGCDVLVPLAAIVGAPACNKNPILASEINLESTIWLFENTSPSQMIIMPTTNSAYGSSDKNIVFDEKSPLNPLSLYARDKVVVEQELLSKENSVSLRLATVFGVSPRMRLDLLVNNFVFRALTDGFIVLFQGSFIRNYIHVRDVVSLILGVIQNPDQFAGEVFNVGLSSANVSKVELANRIKQQIPNFKIIESDTGDDPDKRNYIVSNSKIESLGFRPKFSLDDGISELIRGLPMYIRHNFSNLDF